MPIPAAAPVFPSQQIVLLDVQPDLTDRLDKYVKNTKLPDRAAAVEHILRVYLKVPVAS